MGPNPRASLVLTATWPADPFGAEVGPSRRTHVEDAAARVREAMVGPDERGAAVAADVVDEPHPWDVLADRLLAERERVRRPSGEVELPAHLSASALVRLESDPGEFAQHLRRPVPAEPSPQARRGTRFHAWVEGWYGSASLVDVDALPGADDDSTALDLDEQALRDAFLATEWANRSPVAVEVDIEISVDGYVLRSRIDAVFPDPAGGGSEQPGVVVVDWKTGAPPKDEAARASRELQLAVYRLAWSRWTGTPLDQVRAAFCYVGAGATVYPDRLLDEAEITELLRSATQAQGPQGAGAVEPVPNRRGSRTNAPTRRRPGWEGTNAAPPRRSTQPAAPTLFDVD